MNEEENEPAAEKDLLESAAVGLVSMGLHKNIICISFCIGIVIWSY